MTDQTITSNIDFKSTGAQSVPGTPNITYSLPSFLDPTDTGSVNTNVLGTFPVTASYSVTAGLSGGISLTTGTYNVDYPVQLSVTLPTQVSSGQVFSVDPTLVGAADANFSLSGPSASVTLSLGVNGFFDFSFNKGATITPSFSVSTPFNLDYKIPTSHSFSIPGISGASITLSEPTAFSATNSATTTNGTLPTLTASGQGNNFLAASLDAIALATSLLGPPFSLLNGSYGVSGLMVSYSLLSLPLQAALELGQALTITPEGITASLQEMEGGVAVGAAQTGALGTNFNFTAPTTGSGPIDIAASYSLGLQIATNTGIVGDLSLNLNGPQLKGSIAGATFSVGPVGTYQFFDYKTGLGTINANTSTSSLTSTADYTIAYTAACYLEGTRLLTKRGEVAIEDLDEGDLVVTASGELRRIRWIGRRRLYCNRHPRREEVWPVRVQAGAFGEGLPRRNLWLSPGHNIACEGVLAPISCLINGHSVAQFEIDRVVYWHIELDAHDVILAEGLPAESYLDTGNRNAFDNGGAFVEAHPDFLPRHWADTCLPLATQGPAVAAIKTRLIERLFAQGRQMTFEADAFVWFDGRRLEPIGVSKTRLTFLLPPGGREIELRSKTFVPAHTRAECSDIRVLGLCVGGLQFDGSTYPLADLESCEPGWQAAEYSDGEFLHRWTTGATPVPAGTTLVIVDLAGAGHYWRDDPEQLLAMSA